MAKSVSAYPMSMVFDADTSAFDTSVSKINSELKTLKGQLASVNKLLVFDPKNTEAQKMKLEILNQQVQKNTQKQKMYKEAMDNANKSIERYSNGVSALKENEATFKTTHSQEEIKEFDRLLKENTDGLKQAEEQLRNATIRYEETGVAIAKLNQEIKVFSGKDMATNLRVMGQSLGKISSGLNEIASATRLVSAVSSGALVGATKSAMDFEQQWVAVKKVLRDDADFNKVKKEILDMGRVVPASLESITEAFSNASQLGVSADNLSKFVETILRLDSATNITSSEASLQLAQLFNAMGSNVATVDKFASAIVHLGNNTATTEKQILDMAEGLGATAKIVGFTDSEVLGLASALSSIGLEAAAGGSSISRTLTDIDKAMSGVGKTADERVEIYAKLIDKSVKATKDLWDTNPAQFFTELVGGLNEFEKAGGNVNVMLADLGITNIRQDRSMKGLINSYDNLVNAMNLANIGYEDGTKHIKESNDAWDTLKSKIQLLITSLQEMGIAFGNLITPKVTIVVESITKFIDKLASLDDRTKETILKVLGIVAVFSPFVSLLAKAIGFVSKMALLCSSALTPAIASFLATTLPVVAIVGALVTAFALVVVSSSKLRERLVALGQSINEFVRPIINFLVEKFKSFFDMARVTWFPILEDIIIRIVDIAKSLIDIFTALWEIFEPIISAVWDFLSYLLTGAITGLGILLDGIIIVLQAIIDSIKDAVEWFNRLLGKKDEYNKEPLKNNEHIASGSIINESGHSGGGRSFGANTRGLTGFQSSGIGTLNLATSINVTNNGTPINELEIRRWGETITDIVSTNLGRRL